MLAYAVQEIRVKVVAMGWYRGLLAIELGQNMGAFATAFGYLSSLVF